MLDLARETAPGADVRFAVLPDDPLPDADAIVGVGHALNYLPDAGSIERGLVAIAQALRPGGVLAVDLCDLEWARARAGAPPRGWVGDDWALVTEFSVPAPDRFVRRMATFVETTTARGAGETSATRTSSSRRAGCRSSSPASGSRPGCGRRSAARSSRPAYMRSSGAGPRGPSSLLPTPAPAPT